MAFLSCKMPISCSAASRRFSSCAFDGPDTAAFIGAGFAAFGLAAVGLAAVFLVAVLAILLLPNRQVRLDRASRPCARVQAAHRNHPWARCTSRTARRIFPRPA